MCPDSDYNANDDFARSIELAYEVIRERVRQGGPTWRPRVTNTQGFTPAPFPQIGPDQLPLHNPEDGKRKKGKRRGPRPPKTAKAKRAPKIDKAIKAARIKQAAAQAAPALPTGKKLRKPRALKVDLAVAMSALSGLTDDDAKVVHSFVQALAPFSKKARERICGALVKVVG